MTVSTRIAASLLLSLLSLSVAAQFQVELTLKLDLKSLMRQGKVIRKCYVLGDAPLSGWTGATELTDTDRDSIYLAKIDLKTADIQQLVAYEYQIESETKLSENLSGRLLVIRDTTSIILEDQWNSPRTLPGYEEPPLTALQIKEDKEVFMEAIGQLSPAFSNSARKKLTGWLDETLVSEYSHRQFYYLLNQALYQNGFPAKLDWPHQSLGVSTLLNKSYASSPYRLKLKNKQLWIQEVFLDEKWTTLNLPLARLNELTSTEILEKISQQGWLPQNEMLVEKNAETSHFSNENRALVAFLNSITFTQQEQMAISAISTTGDTIKYILDELPITKAIDTAYTIERKKNKLCLFLKDAPIWNKKEIIIKELELFFNKAPLESMDTLIVNLESMNHDYATEAQDLLTYLIANQLEIPKQEKTSKVNQVNQALLKRIINKKTIEKWNKMVKVENEDRLYQFKTNGQRISPYKPGWPKQLIIQTGSHTGGLGWQLITVLNEANRLNWTGTMPQKPNFSSQTFARLQLPNSGIVVSIPLDIEIVKEGNEQKRQELLKQAK